MKHVFSLPGRGSRIFLTLLATTWIAFPAAAATPGMAVALRAGTTGIGLDYDLALGSHFSARVGYSGLQYHHSVSTSDVHYDGTLKLGLVTALVDWYAFDGGFHFTAGVVGNGIHLDVTGQPAVGGIYTINGHPYSAGEIGSLKGRLKFGNAVSPYVGLGWGDPVGASHHLHFLVDIGAIYGGTPNVTLSAVCNPAVPAAVCAQLRGDLQTEVRQLRHDVSIVKWYPVVDLGLAYRF